LHTIHAFFAQYFAIEILNINIDMALLRSRQDMFSVCVLEHALFLATPEGDMSDLVCRSNTEKHKETTALIKQNISVVISKVHKEQKKMTKPFPIEKFLHIFKMKIFQGN
jgi:hypothetical protein